MSSALPRPRPWEVPRTSASIQNAAVSFDLTPGTHWSLGRARHRFFDSLVAYLVSVASIGATLGAQARTSAGNWEPSESFVLNGTGRIGDIGLVFHPHSVMNRIAEQRWPEAVTFLVESIRPEARTIWDEKDGPNVEGMLLRGAFVQYFESVRNQTGIDATSDSWRFGRIVRNAFVHDGRIRIDDPQATPASWRGITYGPRDNGRQILGLDIAAVEVVLLMRDMDEVGR